MTLVTAREHAIGDDGSQHDTIVVNFPKGFFSVASHSVVCF